MNQIDIKFQELLSELKRKGIREIFCNIKEKYLSLPIEFQRALENYYKTFDYWGKLDSSMGEYESLYKRAISLKDHIDDYEWLYNKLSDYRSKKLLYAILNNWYKFDMETTKTSLEKNYQQYQDLDIIKPTNEEVIVSVSIIPLLSVSIKLCEVPVLPAPSHLSSIYPRPYPPSE